jgi:hypothetical protein
MLNLSATFKGVIVSVDRKSKAVSVQVGSTRSGRINGSRRINKRSEKCPEKV